MIKNTGVISLLRTLFSRHPYKMSVVVLSMTAVSVAQGMSVALLSPLLSLAGLQGPSTSGRLAKGVETVLNTVALPMTIQTVLLLFLLLVVIENTFRFLQMAYTRRFIAEFVVKLRLTLYEAYLDASWPYWLEKHMGHLASRLTGENYRVEVALNTITSFLSDLVLVGVLFSVAFVFSWSLALIFLVCGGLVMLIMESRFVKRESSGQRISSQNNTVQEVVHEHLSGAKLIKSAGLQNFSLGVFEKSIRHLSDLEVDNHVTSFRISAIFNPFIVAILCVGFYSGVAYLHVPATKGLVILFVFFRLSTRLSGMQNMVHTILTYSPAYAAILKDIQEASLVPEQECNRNTKICAPLSHAIELKGVSYAYLQDKPVLHRVDISIPVGKTIAVVGESGSGKSTVLDVMVGLLRPKSGNVMVDGIPLTELDLNSWRRQIGYVGQDPILFFDSIANNIRWTNPQASDDDLRNVARLAQAHDFISNLKDGYNTPIGHRGIQLSGGERQRIALARAIVRHPSLLILDEATSALDSVSEKYIQDAIDGLRNKLTIIVVTHRLNTVRNADYIYVMGKGCIVQQGTWDELATANGLFNRMLNS
jgi:ATP-binding cassette subfamily C protein